MVVPDATGVSGDEEDEVGCRGVGAGEVDALGGEMGQKGGHCGGRSEGWVQLCKRVPATKKNDGMGRMNGFRPQKAPMRVGKCRILLPIPPIRLSARNPVVNDHKVMERSISVQSSQTSVREISPVSSQW